MLYIWRFRVQADQNFYCSMLVFLVEFNSVDITHSNTVCSVNESDKKRGFYSDCISGALYFPGIVYSLFLFNTFFDLVLYCYPYWSCFEAVFRTKHRRFPTVQWCIICTVGSGISCWVCLLHLLSSFPCKSLLCRAITKNFAFTL